MSILLLASIREILIISTPHDLPLYKELLGDGSRIGVSFFYKEQKNARGLADAFIIGEDFIGNDSVCLILGDNVFYGSSMTTILKKAIAENEGATVFGYPVKNPTDFGVLEFDEEKNVIGIKEKPKEPKSNYAIPGLYFYDNDVIKIAKSIKPSDRGEIEITSINNEYLKRGKLKVKFFERGFAWLDTGTPEGMINAAQFVQTIQERQGFYLSCIEEIAWRRGFITTKQLREIGEDLKTTEYGRYLLQLCDACDCE